MNQAVASIIKAHIEDLDFVDKIAGLVAPLTFEIKGKDNTLDTKTFPIACCVSPDDCQKNGAYNELMPNSAYKTVIYFEDNGVKFTKGESNWKYYTSSLRLVCWINVAKILGDTCNEGTACTLAAHLIVEIIRAIPEFPQHHNPFNYVHSEITGQDIRNPNIFGAYTYDEKHSQYLMYPYDYFALDIETTFAVCMVGRGVYDSDCGHNTDTLDAPVADAGTEITKTSFDANWNAVVGATGYKIDVATDAAFTNMVVNDTDVDNVLTINITGLTRDTTYYYRVRAYNDTVESGNSNIIDLTTFGWFLPSKDELNLMYTQLKAFGVGGFGVDYYWSSSEEILTRAYLQSFTTGVSGVGTKVSVEHVRPCRSFTSTVSYSVRDTGPLGGLIFWKSGNDYLEAAPSDLVDSDWSNIDGLLIGTTGTAVGTGKANTLAIIGQAGHTNSAAKLCDDLVI